MKKIIITLGILTLSLSALAESYQVNEDIALSGTQAKKLYFSLSKAPVKQTNRDSSIKSIRTAEGSIIECEIYASGEAHCMIKVKGTVDQ